MSDEDFIRWFAGFMDGEGSWRIKIHGIPGRTKRIYFHLEMSASNTDGKTMRFIQRKIPAYLKKRLRNPPNKDSYFWKLSSKDRVKELTNKLYPYLITKKKIAKVILDFPKMDNSVWCRWDPKIRMRNDEIYKKQVKLRQKALLLNKKGK